MRHGEEPGILDKHLSMDSGQKFLRDMGRRRCLCRSPWGHHLWTCRLILGYQFFSGESRSPAIDMECQHMFAEVFRGIGMIFARTGITFPDLVHHVPVRLTANGSLTIRVNRYVAIQNNLDCFLSTSVEFWH